MCTWKSLGVLACVVASCGTLDLVAYAESKNPSLEIVGINNAVEDGRAMLEVEFTNPHKSPITIPFFGIIRKKTYDELAAQLGKAASTSSRRCQVVGNQVNYAFLGEFAQVRYEWKLKESCSMSGVYELSTNQLELQGGQSKRIYIPVKSPLADGEYLLSITFDNTPVMLPSNAAGNRLLSKHYVFFSQTTNAKINIMHEKQSKE